MKRIACLTISILAATAGCKSYEDAFNRNLNSTGLYVANSGSNTVSMFAADPKSGILNDLGTVTARTTPVHVAVNSDRSTAFVSNSGSANLSVYSMSCGVLTAAGTVSACTTSAQVLVNSSSYATGSTPTSVAGY